MEMKVSIIAKNFTDSRPRVGLGERTLESALGPFKAVRRETPMKFLHTADWQIGMKAVSVGAAGAAVRRERLAAAERVVDVARCEGAEFILLAGDVFEDNGVDRGLVERVAAILGSAPCPVFAIPGNHDPLVPGSVWDAAAWASAGNVRILRTAEPIDVPGGTLFPCPLRERRSRADPTAWIPAEGGGIRIGVAHGTVEGLRTDEPEHPIPRDAATRKRLDYLALGHWHSTAKYEAAKHDEPGAVRMAYSGTHEPTKFGERESGFVLVVEIPLAGAAPELKNVPTAGLTWLVVEEELREARDLQRVRRRIDDASQPRSTLIEVRLGGVLPVSGEEELRRMERDLEGRFLFARVDRDGLLPPPADEAWIEALPAGYLRRAAEKLHECAKAGVGDILVARRALLDLYSFSADERAAPKGSV